MARIKNTSLLHSFLFLLVTVLLCSCSDEREGYATPVEGKQKSVTFSARVPGAATPKSYALGEPEENEVKTIEMLLFNNLGNLAANPIYSNTIATDPDESKLKTFTVKVPEGTYDMVILTNARASLATALPTIALGDAKDAVLNKILLTNAGKWNSNSASAGYIPIPMWGELTGITVSSTMPTSYPVNLSRMIAKIDVALGNTAKTKFKLQSVRLYNYNNQGAVAPLGVAWDNIQQKVTAPSVPASAGKPVNPENNPLLYDGAAITTANVSCEGEIYTFEAVQGTAAGLLTNTCLVVGGLYDTDVNETFYRIDFANTTGGITTYLDLLRNHQYKVNISDISARGSSNHVDAFRSAPVNIKAGIVQWNESKYTHFVFNDQYLLGLSQDAFSFSKEQRTAADTDNTLSVITDYVPGWKVEKIVDGAGNPAGWLNCSSTSGSNPTGNDIKLLMAANATGVLRTAYIHLSAERLTYIVKVEQDILSKMAIDITDITGTTPVNTLFFTAAKDVQPAQQQFKISWFPTTQDLNFSTSSMTNAFTFATGAGLDQIPNSGTLASIDNPKSYTIRPTAITTADLAADPFYERTSTILYTVTDGLSMATKALVLRQLVYNIVPKIEPVYLMDGTGKSFSVRSNSPFIVTLKTNPNNVVSGLTTTGVANTTAAGTPVNFTIIDDLTNPTLFQKDVVVTLKSPGGLFPDTDVTLNCASGIIQPKSNSYIVAPGGVGVLIPVDRANESMLGNQLGVNEAFTANLVWTDNVNKIADNSNIKMLRAVGSGTGGYILVMPGSQSGNAVVAVKNSANKILWSWHIWVTGYNPAPIGTGKFMDRNLGAFSNTSTATVTDISAKGLLYQWGRKDPFPGSTTLSANTEPTLYTATGTTVVPKNNTVVANNFANTVRNPEMFYYSATAPYDWYTNGGAQNDALWGPASKTVYDPCPDEWRVPQNGVWAALTTANFTWGNYGRTATNHGGFYPAAGYRYFNGGALLNAGAGGYYWSATVSGVSGYYLGFSSSGVSPSYGNNRAYGFSVRCVQE